MKKSFEELMNAAQWTDDCQGKKNYDGPMLDISTRYWPGSYQANAHPSAHAAIVIRIGDSSFPDEPDYKTWREVEFDAPTEPEVRALVEEWVAAQYSDVLELLARNP